MPFRVLTKTQHRLLKGLVKHAVRFAVVGGYAVRVHGHMRPVEDLDLLVDRNLETLQRLWIALNTLGAERVDEIPNHLSEPRKKIKWYDAEFFSSLDDLDEQHVFDTGVSIQTPVGEVLVMSRESLLESKRIALRSPDRAEKLAQDQADLEALESSTGPVL